MISGLLVFSQGYVTLTAIIQGISVVWRYLRFRILVSANFVLGIIFTEERTSINVSTTSRGTRLAWYNR